jgi:hypothetical protein
MSNRPSRRVLFHAAPLVLALGVAPSTAIAAAPSTTPPSTTTESPTMDPRAVTLLRQSADRLRAIPAFEVRADSTLDEVLPSGFKAQRTMTEKVVVRKPDRMHAEVIGDDGLRMFFYDGKSVSLLVGPENYYATVAAPPTIRAMLDQVSARYDLQLPLADLLYMATGEDLGESVTEAGVIGTSRVAGVECEHVAFRTNAADWQVWIERGSLLPRRFVVTTRTDPSKPQYQTLLTWNLDPVINETSFQLSPGPGALPIKIAPLGQSSEARPPEPKAKKAKSGPKSGAEKGCRR